jgi:hypothetical protein
MPKSLRPASEFLNAISRKRAAVLAAYNQLTDHDFSIFLGPMARHD